jgi:polysaccharide export outer membrane protein
MRNLNTIFAAMFLFWVLGSAFAQTREPDPSQQVPAAAPEARANEDVDNSSRTPSAKNPSSMGSASPYSRDAFSTTMTSARVLLGPGDLLEISIFDTPELTQRVRVDSEGKITLSLIGEITVRGMVPDKLAGIITRKLVDGKFMKDPQVSVFVMEYAGQMAYVTGEVAHPGAYALLRSHRLLDLISLAGGLSARAGNTVTIARTEGAAQPIQVDLSDKDEKRSNPEILPGDSITVGQAGIVYVLGDVERPGGFVLDRRTTLSVVQAVALAEGAKPSATLSKTVLIRNLDGKRQEIPLNLKMILKSRSPDLLLAAGDIIYVPGSVIHGMGRTSLEVIESSAGLAAVYATRP